ncbi:hypothetical protein KKC45_02830 [Patescibacteria group bacterium]|nr:hypothetical protein [Patescibacteria group bacterium]
MENLTILEKEVLEILKQLEYCCEAFILYNKNSKDKFIPVMFADINLKVLQKGEHIHDVEKYLQNNGVNFSITFDLENDVLDMYFDKEHPDERFIEFGEIKGKSLSDIKKSIQLLYFKLDINKSKNIWLDEKGINSDYGVIFPFKIIKGSKSLPRTKTLIFLSKQKNNIPTKQFFDNSGFTQISSLKRSIDEINTVFISHLGKELICHDKVNGTFGINKDSFNFTCRSKQ